MKKLIQKFDFEKCLSDNNIPLFYTGSNVGKGWIGTNCPFCIDGDRGGHLGINKTSKIYSCWKCKSKGGMYSLVKKLFPNENIEKILQKYSSNATLTTFVSKIKNTGNSCTLPKGATQKILPLHKKYLLSRNFQPEQLYKDFNLRSTGISSGWGYRIIIPITLQNRMMSYVGRDVTGKALIRYKAVPIEQSIRDTKSLIYNIDSATDRLILVEGATDVWRIGQGCGASMGAALTPEQILQITSRNFQKVFVLYDSDTTGKIEGLKFGQILSQYVETEIINLPDGIHDPGELCKEDVGVLRKQIFGKIY